MVQRRAFLTWLFWHGSMMGPVLRLAAARVEVGHLYVSAAIRGVAGVNDRLRFALERGPWLLGAQFSAADLLCSATGWRVALGGP